MTSDNLADATGLDKGYLSRIERDERSPSIATVVKIAQALKASVATLFGETTQQYILCQQSPGAC